jgi:uncharacterized protein (DUF1697 family)
MVYIALLRAVNVAGRSLMMAELRAAAQRLGLRNVTTVLQSGNLVFEASKRAKVIERELEADLANHFRLQTSVTVWTATELATIVRRNPFAAAAKKDPAHLVVVFLKDGPTAAAEGVLRAAIVGRERIKLDGRVLYAVYPDGIGRSKLTAALIDRSLGTSGTARNWNTVLKLKAATETVSPQSMPS